MTSRGFEGSIADDVPFATMRNSAYFTERRSGSRKDVSHVGTESAGVVANLRNFFPRYLRVAGR